MTLEELVKKTSEDVTLTDALTVEVVDILLVALGMTIDIETGGMVIRDVEGVDVTGGEDGNDD